MKAGRWMVPNRWGSRIIKLLLSWFCCACFGPCLLVLHAGPCPGAQVLSLVVGMQMCIGRVIQLYMHAGASACTMAHVVPKSSPLYVGNGLHDLPLLWGTCLYPCGLIWQSQIKHPAPTKQCNIFTQPKFVLTRYKLRVTKTTHLVLYRRGLKWVRQCLVWFGYTGSTRYTCRKELYFFAWNWFLSYGLGSFHTKLLVLSVRN